MSAMFEAKPTSTTPKYMIGTVTKRTGLSVDVVRVWERRYGAVRPQRTQGGTRLYSDADVSRLIRLKRAVEMGHSIGEATRLSENELDELIATSEGVKAEPDPHDAVRERFLEAIQAMNASSAEKELTLAATLYPVNEFVKSIVAPILDEVGDRWAHKEIGIAQEHLATGLLRGILMFLVRLHSTPTHDNLLVLATLPEERHEIGLLLVALLAAAKGWRLINLGADVPAAEIALAVRLTGARALALSVPTSQPGTRQQLEALSGVLPVSTRVWIGGAASLAMRPVIESAGWLLVRDLDDLENRLGN